jgi:hypothetical protein
LLRSSAWGRENERVVVGERFHDGTAFTVQLAQTVVDVGQEFAVFLLRLHFGNGSMTLRWSGFFVQRQRMCLFLDGNSV